MEMPDNFAESIQTAVSSAFSSALAPVLQGLPRGRSQPSTSQGAVSSDEDDFVLEPTSNKRYIITRRMQCIVGLLYAVYTAAVIGRG